MKTISSSSQEIKAFADIPNKEEFVYQFKITLKDMPHKIWRRFQISPFENFLDLHKTIQICMDWGNYHLHEFRFKDQKRISTLSEDTMEIEGTLDEEEELILDHFTKIGNKCIYTYDFGDSWDHELILERFAVKKKDQKYPICVKGENKCPPEDIGSTEGFVHFLEVIQNPKHPEYEELINWYAAGSYNYQEFDKEEINDMLKNRDEDDNLF